MITISGEAWQWLMVGLDAVMLYGLKRWYHGKVRSAEEIEAIQCYKISDDLRSVLQKQDDSKLPYACIEGIVMPTGLPLHSHFDSSEKGVIQHVQFVEHKSKRTNGYWSDVKNIIKDITRVCGFVVVDRDSTSSLQDAQVLVEVLEPLSAEFLMDSLPTTYDQYTPNSDTILSRGIDRIFGEVSKGYQETEKMLLVGDRVLGIGQLMLIGGKIMLEAPSDNSKHFILSTLTKKQIVNAMKSEARLLKYAMLISGLFGSVLLVYLLRKKIRQLIDNYRINRMYREIQQQRELRHRQGTNLAGSSEDDEDKANSENCIICLDNGREVVLLECGHVCLCVDCARALPEPRKCPICRGTITRYVPLFRP
ncbi:hypothetical protein LSH36_240g03028 [Paralvinella palmiformis]|uniref:RING-type E3 ubiquitin transferase n=1 Tax=Paralvinella palmiformis TaxID=53620 RepID=A0AAD9JLK5_9ANNE|nr:hypothetical protein LSH36_240g03028 [Paralvinella palmiformis]